MLEIHNAIFVCIDIQEKLARAMCRRDSLIDNSRRLTAGLSMLNVPMLWTEQNPEKLGPTLPEIAGVMPQGLRPLNKMSFSCCGSDEFVQALKASRRTDVLIAGIEAHVCVYQTAADLIAMGYRVHAAADCICSRTPENGAIGLERMRGAGVQITSAETVLFELLRTAADPRFRDISRIVK